MIETIGTGIIVTSVVIMTIVYLYGAYECLSEGKFLCHPDKASSYQAFYTFYTVIAIAISFCYCVGVVTKLIISFI